MNEPAAAIPQALGDLIEKQAILERVHCYSRAVDRRDYALLASLYAEDGIDDHTGLYCGPVAGFVEWLRGADGSLSEFIQGLRYLDHYRREAGRWRFERRTVVCDWAQHGPAFWDESQPLIAGKRFGRSGADDTSYEVLRSPVFARHASEREGIR